MTAPAIPAVHNVRYHRGQTVYYEGDPAQALYRVETGLVRVTKLTPRGRLLTVRHVLPGDYFGEEALHLSSRNHQVEALTDATVTPIDPSRLGTEGMQQVTASLCAQLTRVMEYEVHLQTGDLRQRIARYLVQLADTPLAGKDDLGRVFVRATHELIAEGTSSTRESVSKLITDLRQDGLIQSGYRRVTLLDPAALAELADRDEEDRF